MGTKLENFTRHFFFDILFDDAVIWLLLLCCDNVNIVHSVSY
jgi:hypothetical protein